MKKLLICLVCVLLSGCSLVNQDVKNAQQKFTNLNDLYQAKQAAHRVLDQAQAEFFNSIPDVETQSADGWSVKDRIIGYAFTGYNTGNDAQLVNYLKEKELYSTYQKIAKKYNLDAQYTTLQQKASTVSPQSITASFFDTSLDGDIFLCYGGGSSSGKLLGFFIPGTWKHSGFMDTQAPDPAAPILSASDETTSGFCVGYESKLKWAAKDGFAAFRVYGRTDANARAAIVYSKQFIGRSYNVFTSRTSDDSWYCSKVVYRGWLSQGKNLEPTPGWSDPWVTPQDLGDDNDTYWIGGDPF